MNEDEFHKRLAKAVEERNQVMREYLAACDQRDEARAEVEQLRRWLNEARAGEQPMQYKVGDIIVSASGSSYVGEIIYISKEEDVVRHRCRKTGTEYEKSYFGFQCRYMSVEERLEKDKEFCTENIQLHQQIIKLEQKMYVRQRDEARAEVEQLRRWLNEARAGE